MPPTSYTRRAYIGTRVRRKTANEITTSVLASHETGKPVLLHAPPASGKTHAALARCIGFQDSGEFPPVTYFAKRYDLHRQAARLAEQFGVTVERLPSPQRACPCFDSNSIQYNPRTTQLYEQGVSGSEIHKLLDLSCANSCEYAETWAEVKNNPLDFDVLIGHPLYANVPAVVDNRIVIFDEFPVDAFASTFENPATHVTPFLSEFNDFSVDSWRELLQTNAGTQAIPYSPTNLLSPLTANSLLGDDVAYHRSTPVLVSALLDGTPLGNGIIRGSRRDGTITLFDHNQESVTLFSPPSLWSWSPQAGRRAPWAVLGLDATPSTQLWGLLFRKPPLERSVLAEKERNIFERDALGLRLFRIGNGLNPYDGRNVTPHRDARYLFEIQRRHRQRPALITTQNAWQEYQSSSPEEVETSGHTTLTDVYIPGLVRGTEHYGNLKSSNQFAGVDVGCVFGAPHPGDSIIKRWCGFLGLSTSISGSGRNRTYGGREQNAVYEHFVHDRVYHAVMRFARGKTPATVYVYTSAIEKWCSPDGRLPMLEQTTPSKTEIIHVLQKEPETTASDIAQQVSVGPERVRQILNELQTNGLVEKVEPSRGPRPAIWTWSSS